MHVDSAFQDAIPTLGIYRG